MHEEDKNAPWLKHPRRMPCPPPHLHPAPDCDDQLPVFSRVGRGIKGDSLDARIETDDNGNKHLIITVTDESDGSTIKTLDEIIDGGKLKYYYNMQPFNDPATFTITFVYDHPDSDKDWEWTTPAIPYLWNVEDPEHPDDMVGSGVGSLFIKKTGETWLSKEDLNIKTPHSEEDALKTQEKLVYPDGASRDYLKAPLPGSDWSVNLTYGIGGDLDTPNREDLAKILGISTANIEELTNFPGLPIDELPVGMNLKQYIDSLQDQIDNLKAIISDLVNHIFNTTAPDWSGDLTPAITWGDGWAFAKIPEADLNIWSGPSANDNQYANAIRSRHPQSGITPVDDDLNFQ